MAFSREVKLTLPGRDFETDNDLHSKNIRALEAYAELPEDMLALLVKTGTPNVTELRVGSDAIVNVSGVLYHVVGGAWTAIQDEDNSYTNTEIDALVAAASAPPSFVSLAKWGTD